MFRKCIGIFLKPLECFPVNVIIQRDNESILLKQWNVNGRGPQHLSISYPADKNFGTGDDSGARCNLRLEIDFEFLMLNCRMKGMQNFCLHLFLSVDLIGINAAVRDHFLGKASCHIGIGNECFRRSCWIRDTADAGIGPEETDMIGILDPAADTFV